MRIKITESQYKGILKENNLNKLINVFIEKYKNGSLLDIIETLLFDYGFSLDIISKNVELKNFLEDKIGAKIDLSNSFGKLVFLNDIRNSLKHKLTDRLSNKIEDIIQGMLDELVNGVFQENKNFIGALKTLKSIKNMLPKRNYSIINYFTNLISERGQKEGYTVVRKPLDWTFEKGGGRIQSIIDYVKLQPKLPKKTRKGWMEYVGEDPDRKGWMSTVWRAVQDAGIIEKDRDGNTYTYKLGPNAEAFEQGKLIGF